ncbi:glucokinase [Mesobaculum littorinae]|uniref:Glucokinase n=1 Tax=Mesobaculum littorinae TaxID=2486419 RepID=A0A438AM45_9RHOB|nr:glucokinase [Mesobaculum littorinae]RVV99616.1 glucokinase [Mesobaculum littorinae]
MAFAADTYSLVADIGGTNTRVALAEGPRVLTDTIKRYSNAEFPGLEAVLRRYLDDTGDIDFAGACAAVAGPVHDGCASMTNLDWTLDRETLARATRAENVALLNDLQAQGHALDHIAPENIAEVVINHDRNPRAAELVVGVGTGFNCCPVFRTDTGRYVPPSEAGHINLPIRTEADLRLCGFVETAHGFPSIEDVLSGRGLERVYAWLGEEAGDPRPASATQIMAGMIDDSDPRAAQAVEVFVRLLGTVVGNLALIHLPFGGIYLIGGVARAMQPYLGRFGFEQALRDKGRFSQFMGNFGVSIVEDDYAALTGCACHLDGLA